MKNRYYKPRPGFNVNTEHCRAPVPRDRGSISQCHRFPVAGTDFCASHTSLPTTDDLGVLWVVDYLREPPVLVSVKILKETPKQIILAERIAALGCYERLYKDNEGNLKTAFRTRREAVVAFACEMAKKLQQAENNLAAMRLRKQVADELLLRVLDDDKS